MDKNQPSNPYKIIFPLFAGMLTAGGLYIASLHNYLLFHSLAELFSIVIALSIFIIFWN